jgi:hypothetical protein
VSKRARRSSSPNQGVSLACSAGAAVREKRKDQRGKDQRNESGEEAYLDLCTAFRFLELERTKWQRQASPRSIIAFVPRSGRVSGSLVVLHERARLREGQCHCHGVISCWVSRRTGRDGDRRRQGRQHAQPRHSLSFVADVSTS